MSSSLCLFSCFKPISLRVGRWGSSLSSLWTGSLHTKTKANVESRNNILKRLVNTKLGADASTIHTPHLLLLYSRICLTIVERIITCKENWPGLKHPLQIGHWVSQASQSRWPLLASSHCSTLHKKDSPLPAQEVEARNQLSSSNTWLWTNDREAQVKMQFFTISWTTE